MLPACPPCWNPIAELRSLHACPKPLLGQDRPEQEGGQSESAALAADRLAAQAAAGSVRATAATPIGAVGFSSIVRSTRSGRRGPSRWKAAAGAIAATTSHPGKHGRILLSTAALAQADAPMQSMPVSAPGLDTPLSHLHRDWAHPCYIHLHWDCAAAPKHTITKPSMPVRVERTRTGRHRRRPQAVICEMRARLCRIAGRATGIVLGIRRGAREATRLTRA
jgi:hypothetical protein